MITMEQTREDFIETLSEDERKCYLRAEFYTVYPILLELWRTPMKCSNNITVIKEKLHKAKEACLRAFIRNLE